MTIRTLQFGNYRNCKVYYRKLDWRTFEYIAVIKGEVYTAHFNILKEWWQYLLFQDFTDKQLTNICNYLAKFAESTVDTVLDAKS